MNEHLNAQPFEGRSARFLHLYAVPAAVILLAFLSVGPAHALWPLLALGAGAAAFFSTRLLLRRIAAARQEHCGLVDQLIQAQKMTALGELSTGIAHEINNPLSIIIQEAEWIEYLLQTKGICKSEQQQLLASSGEICKQVDRCKEITHKMLEFARKGDVVLQSVDINLLIEDMAVLIEKEARLKGIRIHRRYDTRLPKLETDPPLLRQVVLNIMSNAVQAIGKNGEVTIRTGQADGRAEIAISDNGPGIPEKYLDKIFNPFFTTKEPGKGTGLGLSLCMTILHRLGGTLSAANNAEGGAVFTIRMPKPAR